MGGVAERIEDGVELLRNIRITGPHVGGRNHQIFRKRSVPVYTDSFCIPAVFLMAFQTVPTLTAGDMAFTGYQIPHLMSGYARACLHDLAHIFVACGQADRNGVLCPVIPLIDVYVRTADGRLMNLDFYIIRSNGRNRHALHPEPFLRFLFRQCPHGLFLHDITPFTLLDYGKILFPCI